MEIKKTKDGSKLTIAISGELNTITAPELNDVITNELGDVKELVLDLTELTYTSSAGLRAFLLAQQTMDSQGSMVMRGVNEDILVVLEETGFSDFLNIEK